MSADTQPTQRDRSGFWSVHARERWFDPTRNDVSGRSPECGWRESVPVDYPSADGDTRGRYHADGDCVLLVKDDIVRGQSRRVVVTVINLRDRELWEQEYVRCQARHGGDA